MSEQVINLLTGDDFLNDFDFNFNNFSKSSPDPEKNMMISVLILGMGDYVHSKKSIQEEAQEWIFGDLKEDWLYSFENICFVLGINPTALRIGLKRLRALPDRQNRSKRMKHLNPAPGNRNKISINSIYQPKNKYEDY